MGAGRGVGSGAVAAALTRTARPWSRLAILAVAGLTLAGCDVLNPPSNDPAPAKEARASAADPNFRHSQTEDLSGFYFPAGEVGEGDARLLLVFIGQTADFEAWEKGERAGGLAPVMLEFAGGQRVLPTQYSVSDDRIRFTGTSDSLGRVTLDARLDAGSLALAKRNLGPDSEPALDGTVTVGGRTYSGVKFAWSLGG